MNRKQELGSGMVSPEGKIFKGARNESMQLLALPLGGEPKSHRLALTEGNGLSWYSCAFYS